MTVKITNTARTSSWEGEWKTSSTGTVVGSGPKLIGQIKDFDGVTDGIFIPGQLRLNPVTIRTGVGTISPGDVAAFQNNMPTYKQWWRGEFGCDNYTSPYYGSYDNRLESYSLVKATSKLNEAKTDVALMLAELMETLEMLANPFKGLRSFFQKGGSRGKSAASQWLEYRYGIMPLLNDIQSIIDAFNRKCQQFDQCLHSRRGMTTDTTTSAPTYIATGFNGLQWTRMETRQLMITSTSIVYYHWFLSLPSTAFRFGFHPSQLPALIWEKVPFSFVVDWLFRVGDWLRAISPTPYMTVNGNCTSQKIVSTLKVTQKDFSAGPYWTLTSTGPSNYTWIAESLIRRVNASLPVAPVFNHNWFSLVRLVDTLALLLGGSLKGIRK